MVQIGHRALVSDQRFTCVLTAVDAALSARLVTAPKQPTSVASSSSCLAQITHVSCRASCRSRRRASRRATRCAPSTRSNAWLRTANAGRISHSPSRLATGTHMPPSTFTSPAHLHVSPRRWCYKGLTPTKRTTRLWTPLRRCNRIWSLETASKHTASTTPTYK